MQADTHRFRLGALDCLVVNDGTMTYPSAMFFSNASKQDYEHELRAHQLPLDSITTPYPSLYLDTGQHRVLVDTGAGQLEPTTGRLVQNLRTEGIDPASIDTVILTHAHPDHIGGNLDANGHLAFPNARYFMSKVDWNFWMSKPALAHLNWGEHLKRVLLQYAANMLPPIQRRIELVDGQAEIVPGIRAIEAPGHTPGHIALEISSQGQMFIDGVDTILHPIMIERPEWYCVVDTDPKDVVSSRRRLLERAAQSGVMIKCFHFPFPGLGRVLRTRDGFTWRPITAPSL
jgi:glyoxylase-like metal-dependent hydrolase (beta-lactamase superfamily II)